MSDLRRERITIRTTEWWSLFVAEVERRANLAAKNALNNDSAIVVYRNQGAYKALNSLVNSLTDPDFLIKPESGDE